MIIPDGSLDASFRNDFPHKFNINTLVELENRENNYFANKSTPSNQMWAHFLLAYFFLIIYFCEGVIIACLQLYSDFLGQCMSSCLSVPFVTLGIDAWCVTEFFCRLLAGFPGCFLLLLFMNSTTQKHYYLFV